MAESPRDEIAKLESMYQANPEGRVFTHLAEAYRKAGDLVRAREVLEDGLRRHADSASGYVVLGRVMQDMGQPQESSAAFARVLELDPENRVAIRSLGELALTEGRTEEALVRFRELQALDPSDESVEALIQGVTGAPGAPLAPGPETRADGLVVPVAEAEPVPIFPVISDSPDGATADTGRGGLDVDAAEPVDLGGLDLAAAPGLESSGVSAGAGEAEAPVAGLDLSELAQPAAEPAEREAPAGAETLLAPSSPLEGLETLAGGEPGAADSAPAPLPEFELPREEEPPSYPPIDQMWGLEPGPDAGAEASGPATEMVTETMADLYRSQGHLLQAAEIYRTLLRQRPGEEQLERKLLEVELSILSPSGEGMAASPVEASGLSGDWGAIAPEPTPAGAVAPLAAVGPEPGAAELPAPEAALPVEAFGAAPDAAAELVPEPVEPAPAEPVAEFAPPEFAPAEPVAEFAPPEPVAEFASAEPVAEFAAADAVADLAAPAEAALDSGESSVPAELAAVAEGAVVEGQGMPVEAAPPETPAVPAMEAVWSGAGDVATGGADSPYAWESGAGDEEQRPPVASYLQSLLKWRRSVASAEAPSAPAEPAAPEAAAEVVAPDAVPWEAETPPAPATWEPEAATWEPAAPSAPAAWEPEAPPAAPAWEPEDAPAHGLWEPQTRAAPAEPESAPPAQTWEPEAAAPASWEPEAPAAPASPEPTWADEAAGEPWREPAAAADSAASESDDSMDWLLGPEGAGAEPAAGETGRAGSAEAPGSPGDDDDLEMFRAWLQSLKK